MAELGGLGQTFPTSLWEPRACGKCGRWALQPPDPARGQLPNSRLDRAPFVYCVFASYPVISIGSFILSFCFHNSFAYDDIIKGILIQSQLLLARGPHQPINKNC